MLRQRVLTSIILAPLILLFLYYADTLLFITLLSLLILGCAFEWLSLIPLERGKTKLEVVFLTLAFIVILFSPETSWLIVSMLFWFSVSLAVFFFPYSQKVWGKSVVVALAGGITLSVFLQTMLRLYALANGRELILYLLFLIWAADIGAYTAGKICGRHQLIPKVSPGKTWEGLGGGVILSSFIMILGYFYFHPKTLLSWLIVSVVTVLISIIGDLFISMLKRRVKLKDTGQILPGHGGILDRLDSLLAASPFFYCGLSLVVSGI